MLRMEYTAEIHSTGGPGLFIFGRAEESGERLLTEYRGKVQLIYLEIILPSLIQRTGIIKKCAFAV